MRTIDRYVMRQVLGPFLLGLLVFTFILIIPPMLQYAEEFIAKGVPGPTVLLLMATLIPQALALTIPMSLLLGLLIGFGRLSADREFVAMQACGVGLTRLLWPVATMALLCTAATAYVLFDAVPAGNQMFREKTFQIIADRAEGNVRPGVFFTQFPNFNLYVRDVPASGEGWSHVFLADTRAGQAPSIYLARRGRVIVNREKQTVTIVLEDVWRDSANPSGTSEPGHSDRILLSIDPSTVFQRGGISKDINEMTLPELRAQAAFKEGTGVSAHNEYIAIHRKFVISLSCLIFGVIGVALGATNRRDGALGSFVLGVVVIFAYYIPLYLGPQMTKGGLLPPWFAAWLPNILLGIVGALLFVWRDRRADQPLRLPLPAVLSRERRPRRVSARPDRGVVKILDRYVTGMYVRILLLSAAAMFGVFYISTVIDRSDKVFKGTATTWMLLQYLWYLTPQYLYYIVPLSVLLAALITIAVLTKNSELIVMKACGISLYRIALPMLACAAIGSATLFAIDQTILGDFNRKANVTRALMDGRKELTLTALSYGWVVGTDGAIYHFNFFDPKTRVVVGMDVYEFDPDMTRLTRRTYIERAAYEAASDAANDTAPSRTWTVQSGWTREFTETGQTARFTSLQDAPRRLEEPDQFGTEQPDPKFMSYSQLREYTERLRTAGFDVLSQQVWLARRESFPFVTLIMTLLAVPFAVTAGRGGAMAGIAVGIGLALVYWTTISVFAAMGTGGLLAPVLAAWAPNLIFGAGAAYLLLTVRT